MYLCSVCNTNALDDDDYVDDDDDDNNTRS